jgi:hypothetical protein
MAQGFQPLAHYTTQFKGPGFTYNELVDGRSFKPIFLDFFFWLRYNGVRMVKLEPGWAQPNTTLIISWSQAG